MKSKLFTFLIAAVLFTVSNSVYSQNNTEKSEKISKLISKKRSFNKKYGFGYRIQLYNGNEQKARKFRARFAIEFPGNTSKLVTKPTSCEVLSVCTS